jgi:hypothetical protein
LGEGQAANFKREIFESMTLQDSTLSKAYEAMSKLEGVSQDELNALFGRLMASPEQLKAELRQEVIEEVSAEFEVGTDEFPVEFYTESDHQVVLGMGPNEKTITIRYLNIDDFTRLSAYIPDVVRYVYKKGPGFLKSGKLDFQTLLKDVMAVGVADVRKGKPTKFMIKLYEELAQCLSNPSTGQNISAGYLRGCLPNQVIQAVRKLVEVNQVFFTGLWQEVPGNIRIWLDMNFGKITGIIKTYSKKISDSATGLASAGGTASGGMTNGSTPLPKSTDSAKQRSDASILSKPTATKQQPSAEKTKLDTSIGDQPKSQKKSQTQTTSAALSAS